MKQDTTRHIVVKSLFSADEFVEFDRACGNEPHSRILRDLANHWSRWKNRTGRTARKRGPGAGQKMAMFPGRRGGAPFPLRL
jgi:hypothetical protein